MKHAVGWRQDGRPPPHVYQRRRQIAHNITDATDFAAAQCTVFGCQEYDVLFWDVRRPFFSEFLRVYRV